MTNINKPNLSFWQIWNMSFGFFGIQFGWALQMANMGPIYEYLGAEAHAIPLLFLAAPLTGLIVQPIIGYKSDRTKSRFGKRKPYFMIGAILSSIALFFMPNASAIWMAAGLLWILDASINISMEPFRAFTVDKLNEKQQPKGFAMQSFFIGAGSVIASALPWMMSNWFGISEQAEKGSIPDSVKFSFYLGAVAFFGAVAYTVFKSGNEPENEAIEDQENSFSDGVKEIFHTIFNMPKQMKKIALVQFFTWPGLFLMWFYYSVAVARNVYGAEEGTVLYTKGVAFAGLTLSFYNLVTFAFALALPAISRKLSKPITHMLCLFAGGIGLISVGFVENPNWLYASMTGIGIAWASILSMPYAILAPSLPAKKVGVYMGVFNFFIVLPEILASVGFGWIMENLLNNNRMTAVMIGGVLMLFAGLLCLILKRD